MQQDEYVMGGALTETPHIEQQTGVGRSIICGSGRRPSHRHIYLNKHTHTHTPTHPSLCHDTPTPPFAQRGPRLGADSPPAVREMPVSPAALRRGGGRKEGRKGRRDGGGGEECRGGGLRAMEKDKTWKRRPWERGAKRQTGEEEWKRGGSGGLFYFGKKKKKKMHGEENFI